MNQVNRSWTYCSLQIYWRPSFTSMCKVRNSYYPIETIKVIRFYWTARPIYYRNKKIGNDIRNKNGTAYPVGIIHKWINTRLCKWGEHSMQRFTDNGLSLHEKQMKTYPKFSNDIHYWIQSALIRATSGRALTTQHPLPDVNSTAHRINITETSRPFILITEKTISLSDIIWYADQPLSLTFIIEFV